MNQENPRVPSDSLSPGRGRGGFDPERNVNYVTPNESGTGQPEQFDPLEIAMAQQAEQFYGRSGALQLGWEQMEAVESMAKLGKLQNKLERIEDNGDKGRREKIESSIKKEIEKVDKAVRMSVCAGQDNILSTAAMVAGFAEPYPYQAQRELGYFSTAEKGLMGLARYFDGEVPETVLPHFIELDAALAQQQGALRVIAAAAASAPAYYDVVRHAGESLINRNRLHANGEDIQSWLSAENPGVTVELTKEQKNKMEGMFIDKEPHKEQLRMLDETRSIIIATAAVAQEDIVDGCSLKNENGDVEHVTMPAKVSPNQQLFIKYVFGSANGADWITYSHKGWDGRNRTIKTPKEISLWYADGNKVIDRQMWLAKMTAILETKISKEQAKGHGISSQDMGIWRQLENLDADGVLALAIEINKSATEIIARFGDKIQNSKFERGAAKVALASILETDNPYMAGGRMGWKFNYKMVDGEVRRSVDFGGIYKAYDTASMMYPWVKYLGYKAGWRATSQLFIPSSDNMRRVKGLHRPDWMPPLAPALEKDKRMKAIWSLLFEPKYKEFRARRLVGKTKGRIEYDKMLKEGKNPDSSDNKDISDYKKSLEKALRMADINPKIAKYLKENTYAYETPYHNVDGKPISYPMSIPKSLEYMNLWQMTRDKKTGESLWEMWQRGVRPSSIDYRNIDFEAIDRMWVNLNMLARFTKLWIDPYSASKDPIVEGFFASPGGQSIAEISKRVYLAFRDLPKDEDGHPEYLNMMAAIIPDMILMYEVHNTGLVGTEVGTATQREKIMKKWYIRISLWKRALTWMPEVLYDDDNRHLTKEEVIELNRGITNLGSSLALILDDKALAMERIAMAAYASDATRLNEVYNDTIGLVGSEELITDEGIDILGKEGTEPSLVDRDIHDLNFEVKSESGHYEELFGRK